MLVLNDVGCMACCLDCFFDDLNFFLIYRLTGVLQFHGSVNDLHLSTKCIFVLQCGSPCTVFVFFMIYNFFKKATDNSLLISEWYFDRKIKIFKSILVALASRIILWLVHCQRIVLQYFTSASTLLLYIGYTVHVCTYTVYYVFHCLVASFCSH